MKIVVNKDGIHIAANGYETRVFVEHITQDKRCLGGYKAYIVPYVYKRRRAGNTFKYAPIGRVKFTPY